MNTGQKLAIIGQILGIDGEAQVWGWLAEAVWDGCDNDRLHSLCNRLNCNYKIDEDGLTLQGKENSLIIRKNLSIVLDGW